MLLNMTEKLYTRNFTKNEDLTREKGVLQNNLDLKSVMEQQLLFCLNIRKKHEGQLEK